MASGDTLVQIHPRDFIPTVGGNPSGEEFGLVSVNNSKGLSFLPGTTGVAVALKRIPKTASFSTGATLKLLLSDDPQNPCVSQVCKFGVSIGLAGTSGAYYPATTTNLGTEVTGTQGFSSTTGQLIELSIAVTVLGATGAVAAADKWALIQVRRLGGDSADTAKGRVILHGVTILDT